MTIAEKIIMRLALLKHPDAEAVNSAKRLVLRTLEKRGAGMPTSKELLKAYHILLKARKIKPNLTLEKLLTKRAVRTLSGVTIVTVLTKPFHCPGKCVYCPTEDGMPKSYISDEPAAARALKLKFDPYEQVARRIKTLHDNGHSTDKIELIVKGGTWNAYPIDYQYWFINECFRACNENYLLRTVGSQSPPYEGGASLKASMGGVRLSEPLNNDNGMCINTLGSSHPPTPLTGGNLNASSGSHPPPPSPSYGGHSTPLKGGTSAKPSILQADLNSLQRRNEKAKHRIIGLTLETRPDFVNQRTIRIMRELGCTRVELGAQTTDDGILKLVKRGHTSEQVKNATRLLKDYGFKVDYHLMPQLPGATPKKDLQMMQEIFDNPDYRPDMIKIYPCTVIKNTELYDWLKKGEYKPYSDKKLTETIIRFKTQVPRYVRISRLIRDIPGHHVEAGNKVTNLRQVIQSDMRKRGLKCNCLRCREVGHVDKSKVKSQKSKVKLFIDQYEASGGMEYFLSFEDATRNVVYAICRLRINNETIEQLNNGTSGKSFIRELHTYGQALNLGKRENRASQHKGLGKRLIEEAEKICVKNKITGLAVISGVGVRDYYRKLGYRLKDTYMIKKLASHFAEKQQL